MEGLSIIQRAASAPPPAHKNCATNQQKQKIYISPSQTGPYVKSAKADHFHKRPHFSPLLKRSKSLDQFSLSIEPSTKAGSITSGEGSFEESTLKSAIQLLQATLGYVSGERLNTCLNRITESLTNHIEEGRTDITASNLPALEQLASDITVLESINSIEFQHEYTALLHVAKEQLRAHNHRPQSVQIGEFSIQLARQKTGQYFRQAIKQLFQTRNIKSKEVKKQNLPDKTEEAKRLKDIEKSVNRAYNKITAVLLGQGLGSQHKARNISLTPYARLFLTEEQSRKLGKSPYAEPCFAKGTPFRPRGANAISLRHTQLSIKTESSHPVMMTANNIVINGKHAGIISQAPRPEELDLITTMIYKTNIKAVLDLTSTKGRSLCEDRSRNYYDPVHTWQSLENEHETASYILKVAGEDSVEWGEQSGEYCLSFKTIQVLDKTNRECLHTFTAMNFAEWPDLSALPPQHLEALAEEVCAELARYPHSKDIKPILVNCLAGLGRSGTFMAACFIIEASKLADLRTWQVGQLTLNAILHLRLSRSGEAVQTLQQAHSLLHLEQVMFNDLMTKQTR